MSATTIYLRYADRASAIAEFSARGIAATRSLIDDPRLSSGEWEGAPDLPSSGDIGGVRFDADEPWPGGVRMVPTGLVVTDTGPDGLEVERAETEASPGYWLRVIWHGAAPAPDFGGVVVDLPDEWHYEGEPARSFGVDLVAHAAATRWAVETGGIIIGGTRISTDRESQRMIAGAAAYVGADPSAVIAFKAASGWVDLPASAVSAIALAVAGHVQACFAAERDVAEAIAAGAITTAAQIDAWAWPPNG